MEGDYLMRHPDRPTLVLPLRNGDICVIGTYFYLRSVPPVTDPAPDRRLSAASQQRAD